MTQENCEHLLSDSETGLKTELQRFQTSPI